MEIVGKLTDIRDPEEDGKNLCGGQSWEKRKGDRLAQEH